MSPIKAPYGSWKSPITTSLITANQIGLSEVRFSGDTLYWLEGRPLERGRVAIVRRSRDGSVADAVPGQFNVRTGVHEYGGGAYLVNGETLFFSDFQSQRIHRLDPGAEARAITPEPLNPSGLRYADGQMNPTGASIVSVRETHTDGCEAINDVVLIAADGSRSPESIVSGRDFYSFPRFSPDGARLFWTAWDHPQMPWDGSELWVGDITDAETVENPRLVAGGTRESIFQPEWGPDGSIHFVSDRTGWWNLYVERDGTTTAITSLEAEFGYPQWVFGLSRYGFLGDGIATLYTRGGSDFVAIIDAESGNVRELDLPYTSISWLVTDGRDGLALIGSSPTRSPEVVMAEVGSGRLEVVKQSLELDIDLGYLSRPAHIEFPTSGDRTAYAFFYPPANKDHEPSDHRPPLIVTSHGGPTASTSSGLSLSIQFWTSRGFGVVDVNYGGSTGYGRAYKERLDGQWGIVDTDDCLNAAAYLVGRGDADPERMAICGKSASGYTTLSALVFHDVFTAGASYYGVADLSGLATDTHKFESRYLDGLIGPYPEASAVYAERSPIEHAERLSTPVILLQGLEDKVVPPAQAEVMVEVLREKGLPFAYITFPGEQHGFRQAANIQRALEVELYFYSRVFGFVAADEIDPITIENLP
jgi:dipeptidyl aminopeptidase/acylaminoacyl peptidase